MRNRVESVIFDMRIMAIVGYVILSVITIVGVIIGLLEQEFINLIYLVLVDVLMVLFSNGIYKY